MTGTAEDSLVLDAAVDAAIGTCGGDARAAVRALIVANNYLEAEVKRLAEAVSSGFTRGFKAKERAEPVFPHFKDDRTKWRQDAGARHRGARLDLAESAAAPPIGQATKCSASLAASLSSRLPKCLAARSP